MQRGVASKLWRALAALAAMLLVVSTPLDSAANAATKALKAGDTSLVMRAMSSFDVVDDVLDHQPGDHATSHQFAAQPGWPPERIDVKDAPFVARATWQSGRLDFAHQHLITKIKRPPRS